MPIRYVTLTIGEDMSEYSPEEILKHELKLVTVNLDLLKNYCRFGISDAQKASGVFDWLHFHKQRLEQQLRDLKNPPKEGEDAKAAE